MENLSDTELAEIDDLIGLPETRAEDGKLVNAAGLAEWLGLTPPNRVSALAREGVLPPRNPPDKRFPLRKAIRAYCDHARAGGAQAAASTLNWPPRSCAPRRPPPRNWKSKTRRRGG